MRPMGRAFNLPHQFHKKSKMRVQSLRYSNFKGHSAALDLAPVTVIRGGNFTHKTTIPLALRLAMAGKLPPPIGTKGIYASLAGNPDAAGTMEVECGLDNGRKLAWKWTRNAQGKISTDGAITADIAMPELMLDPSSFFAKTAAEQVQTVFSVCEVDDDVFSIRNVTGRLGEVDASPVAVRDITISGIRNFMGSSEPENVQRWFEAVLQSLTQNQKTARDKAKTAKGAFEAYRNADPESQIPEDVSELLKTKCAERDRLLTSGGAGNGRIEYLQAKIRELGPEERLVAVIDEAGEMDPIAPEILEDPEGFRDEAIMNVGSMSKRLAQVQAIIENAKTKLAELEHLEACPYCQSSKKGWKSIIKSSLESAIAEGVTERDMITEKFSDYQAKLKALNEYEQRNELIEETRGKLLELSACQFELHELQNAPKSGPSPELLQEIAALEQQNIAFQVFRSNRGQREKLEQNLLKSQCEEAVYKAVIAIVLEEQDKVIAKVFGKVLNVARHFTDGLLNSRLEFANGELGRRVSQQDKKQGNQAPLESWIPFNGFSGTERLLALAGFSVALTGDAPCKLVVLDEMGNLDLTRRTEVAMRMLQLVESGVIDQAILIDVDERPYVPLAQRPGFKLLAV